MRRLVAKCAIKSLIKHEKNAQQRQIEATDRQIDALVHALYGLTAEEIKIVEGWE